MMAINRYQLKHLAHRGQRSARLTLALLANTDRLLGTILMVNTVVNAAAATLTTVITVRLFGEGEWILMIATAIVSFAILVFSEITPKIVGAAYPEKIAPPLAFVLAIIIKIAYPITWVVNLFVRALLGLFRFKPRREAAPPLSLEELRTLVLEGNHYLPTKHNTMLLNLFDLAQIKVDDVMTPRQQIDAVDIEADSEALRRQLTTSHHTRLLIYREQLDDVVGILHVRHVLHLLSDFKVDALRSYIRKAYFIPSGTPILTQLQNFQENRERLGLVVDEYGELQGLVTLEDIIEEIVGEYTTQDPSRSAQSRVDSDGSVLLEGSSHLRVLNRKFGTHFPLSGPRTLNGYIAEHFGDIPESGTTFRVGEWTIEIVQTQDKVVKVVRLKPSQQQGGNPELNQALQTEPYEASSKN